MASELPAARSPHIARLDVVRASAFLAVYSFHFTGHFSRGQIPFNSQFRDYSLWPTALLWAVPVAFGWLGVALFFVLSGFCIHYSTLNAKAVFTTRNFYWRRFLRIYPAYISCVIAMVILAPWLPAKYFNWGQVVAHVLMVHNFFKATFFGLNGSLWSLAVEVQFYLLYPALLYFIKRRMGLDRCLVVALIFNLCFQVYFSLTSESYALSPVRTTWSFPLVTWCDWILGACLAEAYVRQQPLFFRPGLWLVGSALMLVVALNIKTLNVQSYLFGSVFFAAAMQSYLIVKSPLHWFERLLVPVGLVSYSLYLWHEPIVLLVDKWGATHSVFTTPIRHLLFDVIVSTAILAPIAAASYFLLEVALPGRIRTWFANRKPGLVVSAAEG